MCGHTSQMGKITSFVKNAQVKTSGEMGVIDNSFGRVYLQLIWTYS